MRRKLTQGEILAAVADDVLSLPDQPIASLTMGTCLAAVASRGLGLASLVSHIVPGLAPERPKTVPATVHEAARLLADPAAAGTDLASVAMAAANSLLPLPEDAGDGAGQDLLESLGRGKDVAVVGHFPFTASLRAACRTLWVLEKRPRPGDLPAEMAGEILPRADMVAVTGTTLLNGTLAGLLAACRQDAVVVMLGPTTPFAPGLFRCGIDVLAGCDVPDPEAALAGIRAGSCFKGLSGVRQCSWTRPGLAV